VEDNSNKIRDGTINILMFGWEFPPFNSGGLGTACHGLTHALSEAHTKVHFVLPKRLPINSNDTDILFADDYLPNVKIKGVNSLLHPYITSNEYSRLRENSEGFYGMDLLEEVKLYSMRGAEIASSSNFDVIHAHDWLSFGAGVEAKKVSGKPLIVHVHATEFDRSGNGGINADVYNIEKEGMEAADIVITVSNYTKKVVEDKYGIFPDKIRVIHNGIENTDQEFKFENGKTTLSQLKMSGKKLVLFVGRLTMQKGPDYFLNAAKIVSEYYPKVHFVIAGSGDMQSQIIRQIADMGLSDKVTYAGFVRGKELDDLYKSADLYVMPSVSEPFGLTALEAVKNGTPVLLSKQSGVSEVIRNSMRVDFWDTREMANKIVSVLYHKSLRETLRENAWQELSDVTWKKAAEKCVNIYRYLMSTPIVQS
jgi:glycosyltransferase involved in cell wall biosynthesis